MNLSWSDPLLTPEPMTKAQSAIVCGFIPKTLKDEGKFKTIEEAVQFTKERMKMKGWIKESRKELTLFTAGAVMDYFDHWLNCTYCDGDKIDVCKTWLL